MPMNEYLQENPRVIFIDVTFEVPAVDKALVDIRTGFTPAEQNEAMAKLHTVLVDEAAALFVVHDLNPRAYSARVEGFVQAQNWFQDYTTVRMR